MRNFTLKLWMAGSLLLALLLGTQGVAAAEYPSIEELYGRYRFSGELTWTDMGGTSPEAPVPATDYNMIVLPGENENEVKLLGFFGYGNGVTLNYDAATGVLSGSTPTVIFFMTGSAMVTADMAATGGTVDFSYQVSEEEGRIVLTAQNALSDVTYMDMMVGAMGSMSYAAGYTLTKESVTADVNDVAGTYEFTSSVVDMNTIPEGSDIFDLNVTVDGDGKVTFENWFGIADTKVTGTFYAEGGIIVLPHDVQLANGMYFGQGDPDMGGYNPNEAVYFLVGGGKLVTPGYVLLDNGYDEMTGMPLQYAVIGGEAVKKGLGIAGTVAEGDGSIYVADGVIYVENGETVAVYNLQGMKVAEGISQIDGLKAGIYVVKAGNRTAKVALK